MENKYSNVEEYKERNEDKAYDYEMESILAGLHMNNFNEDDYYSLRYERMQDYF